MTRISIKASPPPHTEYPRTFHPPQTPKNHGAQDVGQSEYLIDAILRHKTPTHPIAIRTHIVPTASSVYTRELDLPPPQTPFFKSISSRSASTVRGKTGAPISSLNEIARWTPGCPYRQNSCLDTARARNVPVLQLAPAARSVSICIIYLGRARRAALDGPRSSSSLSLRPLADHKEHASLAGFPLLSCVPFCRQLSGSPVARLGHPPPVGRQCR